MLPCVDLGGFGLENPRLFDSWQARERSIFGTERHISIGLGHHGGLACNRVAQNRETILGADHESVEAVKRFEAGFKRSFQAVPASHPPCDESGGNLAIVVGLEGQALVYSRLRLTLWWLDSDPLCTRHWSAPVENG